MTSHAGLARILLTVNYHFGGSDGNEGVLVLCRYCMLMLCGECFVEDKVATALSAFVSRWAGNKANQVVGR